VGLGLAAGALGALVATCQILTTREVLGETARRGGLGLAGASAYSLRPEAMLTLASPTIFGGPGESYWGPSLPWEGSLYVGLAALALAVWGAWRGRSRGNVRFLVFAAAASLAVAMGSHLGLTTLIFRLVPATTAMRCPNRMALITQFALAALACHGTSVIASDIRLGPHARGAAAVRNVLAFAAFVAATAAITVSLQGPEGGLFAAAVRWLHGAEAAPGQAGALAASGLAHEATVRALWSAALVAALGAAAVWAASSASPAGRGDAGREVSEHRLESPRVSRQAELAEKASCARSAAVAGAMVALAVFADLGWSMRGFVDPAPSSLALVPAELLDRVTAPAGQRARVALVGSGFSQCAGARQGFDTVNGYDQLISARLSDLGFLMEDRKVGGSHAFYSLRSVHPVLDLMAADYIVAGRDVPVSRERYSEVASAARLRLFRSPSALPRAFIVHRAKRVRSEESSREIFFHRGFDPSSEAIVEEDISGLAAPEAAAQERVAIVAYRDDCVELDVTAAAKGLLVLCDSYSRGWRASIDGAETGVIRANHLFRGVVVEPGTHRVVYEYRPAGARLGLALTAAGLALALGLCAAGALAGRARRPQAPGG
jgi:hypothetical protein